jgi:DNA-binding MarR family transcriptional regulator
MMRNRSTVKLRPGLFLQPYVVSELVGRLIAGIVDGTDLSGREFAVTSWLNLRENATPTSIASELGMSATTVSAMVDRLVHKGHIRRVPNPGDGRSYFIELTEAGQTANRMIGARFEVVMKHVRANLDADSDDVLDAMVMLEDALRKTISAQDENDA